MSSLTDQQLLREYAQLREEAAFAELVQRHVDLVYSAALRMVRDAHAAEDVTQGVFLALSRSAGQLTERPVLSGWLHRTAQNLAANAVRTDVRRRAREQQAAAMNELLCTGPGAGWEEIAPHLDAALGELSEEDRDALLLRYFERKSAREMAPALGTSEEAAQKRVNRAVDRLRELLAKRGVTAGAGGLVVLISANAVQSAPVGLALAISASAALAGTAAAAATTSTTSSTLAMTTLQKILITTTLAAAIGVAGYEARQASRLRAQIGSIQRQQTPVPDPSKDAALASLKGKLAGLETQNLELAKSLGQINADKASLQAEREQARHSAALFKELAERASSTETNATNDYRTSRDVWVGWGRFGRLAAQYKQVNQDDSKLSPEEKSALEAAKIRAVEELPKLLKAADHFDKDKPAGSDPDADDSADFLSCLLYGALDLDEQQFGQVYGLTDKYRQQVKQLVLLETNSTPEKTAALKQVIEQWKTDMQSILTPEQAAIFAEVSTHFQFGSGNASFNFSF